VVALVTGAGRGLGAHIARALAAAGHVVAVNDLTEPTAVVEAIRADGGTAAGFAADVTDDDAVAALVAAVGAALGPVDVLVANATGPQPVHRLEELTWDAHLAQLRFFVKSPTLLAQAVVPGMKERGRGRIVHMGSDLFERAEPGWSAYSAAKGALLGLTRVWARELGPHGITVNLVAPGWIPVERHAYAAAEDREWYVGSVPMGRFGVPADVAAAVVFLASDGAGFITGQRLAVNGGHVIT
jgi:3-oxoacyl-[acyl-carrier protein] reductase